MNSYSYKIHHVGIIVEDINTYIIHSVFSNIKKEVYDPLQDSNIALIETSNDIFVELVEPLSIDATTFNFLKKMNGGYHHICYEINSLTAFEELIENNKIKIFWGPEPAILFDGRDVAFGYTSNREIVEFLLPI